MWLRLTGLFWIGLDYWLPYWSPPLFIYSPPYIKSKCEKGLNALLDIRVLSLITQDGLKLVADQISSRQVIYIVFCHRRVKVSLGDRPDGQVLYC